MRITAGDRISMRQVADIGIDFGNSKFSICARGEGTIISEASYIAFRGKALTKSSVIAVGDRAHEMSEQTYPGISVCRPMRDGIIIDREMAAVILGQLAKRAGLRWFFSRPRVYVGALNAANTRECLAITEVAEELGPCQAQIVREPLAVANAVLSDVSSPLSHLIVDVGDGATEALVIANGQSVLASSIRFVGNMIEDHLVQFMIRQQHLMISRSQARYIKENIGARGPGLVVKGSSIPDYLPAQISMAKDKFDPVFIAAAQRVADFVMDLLNRIPPERTVDLVDTGLYLCGGASQTPYLKDILEMRTGLEVKMVENPRHAVIRGLNEMLKYKPPRKRWPTFQVRRYSR